MTFLPDPIRKQLVDDLKAKIILFEKFAMIRMKYYMNIHFKAPKLVHSTPFTNYWCHYSRMTPL